MNDIVWPMNISSDPDFQPFRSAFLKPEDSPVRYQLDALAYWRKKCGDRLAPSWADISLMDFPTDVIPKLIVIDINPDTAETSYRFWGTQLTDLHGTDYTRNSAAELRPKLLAESVAASYHKLVREKCPHLVIQEFYSTDELRGRQIVLRLPLSDDGKRVTNALVVTYQELTGTARPYSEFFNEVLDE